MDLVDAGWQDVLSWLPPNLEELAAESGALQRRRVIRRASDLLRLAMAYAVLDLSLRGVAAWAAKQGIADMSDVAVLKRLRSAAAFLAVLLAWLLEQGLERSPQADIPLRVRIVDATTVSVPGSTGADWRIHASYDPARRQFDSIELTDGRGGEHFGRHPVQQGDLVIGDRGYAHARRIIALRKQGAHVLVRIGHRSVRLVDEKGERVDPVAFAMRHRTRPGRPPRVEELNVNLQGDSDRLWPARLIVVRKSLQATEKERRRLNREARRKGGKPSERTLQAAAYTFLLTTVPPETANAITIAELYRVRWQIELAFKRLKSLLKLGNLRAHDHQLARTYILGKLVAALLVQKLTHAARAFSPWGVPLDPTADQSVEA